MQCPQCYPLEQKVVDIVETPGLMCGRAEIPFPGFYNFKGTVDNKAFVTILQDPGNSEVTEPKVQEIKQLDNFDTEKKDLTSNKIYLEKGQALIGITVTNGEIFKTKLVTKKVFSTADWVANQLGRINP